MRIPFAKIGLVFFCFVLSPTIRGQEFHSFSLYGGVHRAEALGDYKTYLQNYDSKTARLGLFGGILFNPMPKRLDPPPLHIGFEIGGNGWGNETAPNFYGASQEHKYRSFYTNAVLRYRPFTGPVKVSPFVDVFGGPYWSTSIVRELVAQDEYKRLFRYGKTTSNIGIGIGAGFLKTSSRGRTQYIDLGIYYQNVEKVASIRRRTIYLDRFDEASYIVQVIKPDNWKIRLSFTGFL
jgi:hypothetical protein